MTRILVTGAVGFIGSKVCHFLLDAGFSVVGLDSLNDAYDVRLKFWQLKRLENREGFEFSKFDIVDRKSLREYFMEQYKAGKSFDAVINLAARAGVRPSVANPWVYYETNATGTLNLLDLCREFGVRKFVLASTSSLYGAGDVMPLREDADTSRPLSPYAASKKAAEVLCHAYHHLHKLDVTVLRYFTVYGPAGRPDMSLFRFVQWISEGCPVTVFGDGAQSRDFTYVDDIARGTVAALRPMGYQIINLGSDNPVKLMDTIRFIEGAVGKVAQLVHRPVHSADVKATWADITKARNLLGWVPTTACENGLGELVRWYQQERDWAKDVNTCD